MNEKVTVLAPVGSYESLAAAIQAGADAIYFGLNQLNMRARSAKYFEVNDLDEIVSRCKKANVKCYLALNTILYNHDLNLMRALMNHAKFSGVDGVIVTDHAAMQYGRSVGMPLHISTQANISNIEAVSFYAPYADVMVLARELSLKQVAEIAQEIRKRQLTGPSGQLVKLEVFVHGALCMAISGKCYLSLHTQFASANRGACYQNCRKAYILTDKEDGHQFEVDNEYIMSAKDLCTIDILDQVVQTGVAVLKIEGRARSADYVYTTTKCYKEAVQAIEQGTFNRKLVKHWESELSKVYNRGFWEGYYMGRKLGEWSNQPGSIATEKKVLVGKGQRYYPRLKVGEFAMESGRLKEGDEIMIISQKTGITRLTLQGLQVNGCIAYEATGGDHITFPLEIPVSEGDVLYKVLLA